MNLNISSDLTATSMMQTQTSSRPPPPPRVGSGSPPGHASTIEKLGSGLSNEVKDSLYAGVRELENSDVSFKEIKAFVDSSLETNHIDQSEGQQRTGHLVDMIS